ncbi:MAG: hypothetical protein OD814_000774 [Candidatus Alkanophagales archaeon MCA70_species_1]|nr:hypothetical protein [Candidatus Alkanophaga volatiphilum]
MFVAAAAAFLLVIFITPAVAEWHGGKALVLYKRWCPSEDGWVQYSYKNSSFWREFRNELVEQGWTVDYARHVNASLLSNYDALFVLTPVKNIPDEEAQAIIDWVKSGGQLVITQDERKKAYANEITKEFGIEFGSYKLLSVINEFGYHPITKGLSEVNGTIGTIGLTAHEIKVSGSSKEIGGYEGLFVKYCLLAVNDTAEDGVVVAIGDEWMWSDLCFNLADNEELLDNILAYFWQTRSVPEYPTPLLPSLLTLGAVFLLLRRRTHPQFFPTFL